MKKKLLKRWKEPLRSKFLVFTKAVGKLPLKPDVKLTLWLYAGTELMRAHDLVATDLPEVSVLK